MPREECSMDNHGFRDPDDGCKDVSFPEPEHYA